jgi:predicted MFS family arabinose efflux permease
MMWLSVIPAIAGVIVSLMVVEPKVEKSEEGNIYSHLGKALKRFREKIKLRHLSLASIIGFGQGEAGFQFRPAFYQTLWPVWAIGLAHALSNVGATLSYYYSDKLIKRFGALKTLIGGKIYALASNTFAFAFPTVVSPAILVSNSLFFGSGSTSKSTLMQEEYTNKQRSTMESLNSLGGSLFYAVVSFCLGFIADSLSPSKALLVLQLLSALSLYVLWRLFKRES